MSLKELQLDYEYRSDTHNIVSDFYIPCFSNSISYSRAVGYFTSHGLALAAKGLVAFLENAGHMRLIASPFLESLDIEAIEKGYKDRESIYEQAILRQLEPDSPDGFSDIVHHRLECLAWLIAEERLEIKIAYPVVAPRDRSIYHEKIGVFRDSEGNRVAFTGSPNETTGGLVSNFESFDVFVSWDDPHGRIERKISNFERLWNNSTEKLTVIDFPEAARRKLLSFRSSGKPTIDPEIYPTTDTPIIEELGQIDKVTIPTSVTLRYYQEEAYEKWRTQNGIGILSMATGTGKTITALATLVRLYEEHGKLFSLITCPYQHLVDQWVHEAQSFGFRPILAYRNRKRWENDLNEQIVNYKLGVQDNVMVITTHSTFISDAMQQTIERLKGLSVIVADEMHHLGAIQSRNKLPEAFKYRIGLSATPSRHFDEEGTEVLKEYFGSTAYEFSLEQAIEEGYLSEYYYYPHIVELTNRELQQYQDLTRKIAQLFSSGYSPGENQRLDALLRDRSHILNIAANKLDLLANLIAEQESVHHTLFYCTHGQIDDVIKILGTRFGIRVSPFTSKEPITIRSQILEDFASGTHQALAAMHCLDEGVDVPSTETAYLLASSSNPREFIQRRGRILRKSPNKEYSTIHDMITVPSIQYNPKSRDADIFNTERRIIRKELTRFKEFAEASRNSVEASDVIWDLAESYNLLDF